MCNRRLGASAKMPLIRATGSAGKELHETGSSVITFASSPWTLIAYQKAFAQMCRPVGCVRAAGPRYFVSSPERSVRSLTSGLSPGDIGRNVHRCSFRIGSGRIIVGVLMAASRGAALGGAAGR